MKLLVAVATRSGTPINRYMMGTLITPPPTPSNPESAPAQSDPANPAPSLLRLMESLVYEKDEPTMQQVQSSTEQYIASIKQLPADKLAGKKDDVRRLTAAYKYLANWQIVPASFEPKVEVEKLAKDQGWDKR